MPGDSRELTTPPGTTGMRVLIVTYHFPPDAEVGAVRPHQLARYLPEFGIEPWVLTVQAKYAEILNNGLAAQGVPEERILRTRVLPFAYQTAVLAWQGLVRPRRADPASRSEGRRVGAPGTPNRGDWARNVIGFPDQRIGWYLPALRAATRAAAQIGFDAIVSTSPPRVATMVAASLASRLRLPWLMDLRDPWWGAFHETDGATNRHKILTRLHRRLFRSYAKQASLIVHNTERLSRLTSQLVPEAAARTRCVPNGIDPAWEARESTAKPGPAFRISHYGQIMGRRSPASYLHGLRRWIAERPEAADTEVRFYGSGFEEVQELAGSLQLHEQVRVCGALPRESVPAEMAKDFALLLLANAQPLQLPGKAYEYVASGRRILAMTELDSATAEFLKPIDGCLLAENAEQVTLALNRLYDDYKAGSGSWVDRRAAIAALQYRRRVERFAELIRESAHSVRHFT